MYRHQNHQFLPHPPKRMRLTNNVGNFAVIAQFLEGLNWAASQQQQQSRPADQDFMGPEFDRERIKVRHESDVRALYYDLSRQCKTCGMRFKSEEKHRDHLDWHFRKNRDAKRKPSRSLFPISSLWLHDIDVADHTVVENQKDELFAVPADEYQEECPLCMEPFYVYMSDDTNDWMYRGTVHVSEAKASSRKFYNSLLGRIVHAKCIN